MSADGHLAPDENAGVDLASRIVHRDERLVVLDKPSGLPSVRAAGDGDRSLHELLGRELGRQAWIIHRLDRGTSGLIAFALDREAHHDLSALFETRAVRKVYRSVVLGHLQPSEGEVNAPLRIFGSGRVAVDPRGRPARTRYRLRERLPEADVVDLTPETGRRHQIRVHCYALGHPVLGDDRYGSRRPVGGAPRLMLHATDLVLPGCGEAGGDLALHAEPGEDFQEVLDAMRGVGPNGS